MTTPIRTTIAVAAILLTLDLVAAQQVRDTPAVMPKGTAVLGGTVVADDATHRPVRRATVSLNGAGWPNSKQVATDDQGRFLFTGLPAGLVAVSATKPGFVTAYYGGKRPGRGPAAPIALEEAQRLMDVTLKMTHGAALTGTIVDQNGRPQPDVRVTVSEFRMQNGERTLVGVASNNGGGASDDRGIYRVWGLPPGNFVIAASPQNQGSGLTRLITPDELQWAQQLLQAPAGRASGTAPTAGAPSFPSAPGAPPPAASVTPAPQPGHAVAYAPVYFPSVSDPAQAVLVTVAPGEEHTGVDIALQLVPTSQIECVVLGPDGQPLSQAVQLTLARAQASQANGLGIAMSTRAPGADRTGKFTFQSVVPGQYTLIARVPSRPPVAQPGNFAGVPGPGGVPMPPPPPPPPPPGGNSLDLWASLDLSVSGQDVKDLVLSLRPGMTVAGRIVFEGTALPLPPDLTKIRVNLSATVSNGMIQNPAATTASADGTFNVTGVTPGKFRINAGVPMAPGATSNWTLKSAVVGGRDVADTGFEVRPNENIGGLVLTYVDRQTELSGALLDAKGKPTTGYVVLVFTTDRTLWVPGSRRVRQLRPGLDGKFKLTSLPAGEYFIGAIEDLDPPDMGDPAFLEEIAAASIKMKLLDGEKKVQNLKLATGGTH